MFLNCDFFLGKIIISPKMYLLENLNYSTDVPKCLHTFLGMYDDRSYIRKFSESHVASYLNC